VVTARNAVGESPPSGPSASIVPDALPSVPAAPASTYVGPGQLTVSWAVPLGDFTPVTGMSLQVLENDAAVRVYDNVSSPYTLGSLNRGSAYRFQVRAVNQRGTTEWSAPSGPIVPSDRPGAPSNVRADFVYNAGQRGIQIAWEPPGDLGGEPVQSYRVLLNNGEIASGGGDFRSTYIDYPGNAAASVSVIATNSRGAGPPATVAVTPFERPGQVTGLTVQAGDRSLNLSWDQASSPGSSIANYDYRVDGGQWLDFGIGQATSATIGPLSNGTPYRVEVRACNTSGFGDDVRCGPASESRSGTPFGPLPPPEVDARLADPNGSQITVSWSFPDGNGRPITERTVQLTGAVTEVLDANLQSWTSPKLGLAKKVTVTVSYCVEDGTCSEKVTREATTPTAVPLATLPVGTLTGTCGTRNQTDGEWAVDQAACGSGTWVPVPAAVAVTCVATGTAYPTVPQATTTDNRWYRVADNSWYRFPSFAAAPIDLVIPNC
jgi:large repetitive protein